SFDVFSYTYAHRRDLHSFPTRRSSDLLQVMGGMGYSKESLVEYCVRRIRGWMIAGGSIEMLKNRIAEGVFGRSFSQRLPRQAQRSEEHTSELQSRENLVCRLLLEKKKV